MSIIGIVFVLKLKRSKQKLMQWKCFEGHGDIYAREHKMTVRLMVLRDVHLFQL